MSQVFKTTKYSNYLGEQRPLLDIVVKQLPNTPTPTPSITPSMTPTLSITPTMTPTISLTPTNTITPSVTPTYTPTNTPTPSPNIGIFYADAYLDRVVLSGGTVTTLERDSTRTFFSDLVSNGLFSKLWIMYPFIGGTALSMGVEAVKASGGPLYPMTLNNFSLSSSGITGNGTSSYGDVPGTALNYPEAYGIFIGTDTDGNYCDVSGMEDYAISEPICGTSLFVRNGNTLSGTTGSRTTSGSTFSNTDSRGLYVGSRINDAAVSNNVKYYKNGSLVATKTEGPTRQIADSPFIGCYSLEDPDDVFTRSAFSNRLYQFYFQTSLNTVMSDSDITLLSSLINTYQQNLGRYSY